MDDVRKLASRVLNIISLVCCIIQTIDTTPRALTIIPRTLAEFLKILAVVVFTTYF